MKIAILGFASMPVPSPSDRVFAPGVIIGLLADGLTKKGHEVDLFAPSDSTTKANLVSYGPSVYSQFKELMTESPAAYGNLVTQDELFTFCKAAEKINQGLYDVVLANDYRKMMYFSKFIQQPVYYTYHGNPLEDIATDIDKRRAKEFYQNNLFIAPSKRQVELGKEYFNFATVIPHGIDLDNFVFDSTGGSEMLFSGRLIKRKSPGLALSLSQSLNIPINIIGQPSDTGEDKEYFETEVKPKTDGKVRVLLGHIEYDQMSNYYRKAKVLVNPIQWEEPFGLVMIEAMACGTPVVTFDKGAALEIVDDGVTGFVVPSETGLAGLIEAVKNIYAMDEESYRKMRLACRHRVEANYSKEKMVNSYSRFFQERLGENNS